MIMESTPYTCYLFIYLFKPGLWRFDSSPHTCKASAFPTEPSSQPSGGVLSPRLKDASGVSPCVWLTYKGGRQGRLSVGSPSLPGSHSLFCFPAVFTFSMFLSFLCPRSGRAPWSVRQGLLGQDSQVSPSGFSALVFISIRWSTFL